MSSSTGSPGVNGHSSSCVCQADRAGSAADRACDARHAASPGVTDRLWEMKDVVEMLEVFEASQKRAA
jgi:hypothetical protein